MALIQKGRNVGAYLLFLIALLAVVTYLLGEWDAMSVHRRELALVPLLKHSQETDEELAARLQVELETLDRQTYRSGAFHHLSLALLISIITILAVENRSKKQMQNEFRDQMDLVKKNVWEALGVRLLGTSIATELESIMKENAAREDCSYVISFLPSPKGIPEDRQLVRVENSFDLRNLTGTQGKIHRIRASIIGYERFGNFPRFICLTIDGKEQDLTKLVVANDPARISKEVRLPDTQEGRVRVSLGMEVVYKRRDAESFITEIPVEGLHVTVVNQVPGIIGQARLDLFHGSGVAEHPTECTWHYRRALLPGQGFSLIWDPANLHASQETPPASTSAVKEK